MRKHRSKHQSTKRNVFVQIKKRFRFGFVLTVEGLIQARSGCFRLRHLGKRYDRERSPTKSRFDPSSTEALICSSDGSVRLRIN